MCFTLLEPFYVSDHLSAPCQDPDTAALDATEQITIGEQSCWLNSVETKHLRASEKQHSSQHPSAVSAHTGPGPPQPLGSRGGTRLGQSWCLGCCAGALPCPVAGHGVTVMGWREQYQHLLGHLCSGAVGM